MAGLIISVITNKGGTGKTTTVVSLGQALVREGKKVLALEPGLIQKRTKEGFNALRKG
ncbi:MAG: AAA family ATPase [Desulfobacterales bacterium]